MIYLEKSISLAAVYYVYQPNDDILWSQLRVVCERFLAPLVAGRALHKFDVVCDTRNNLPQYIASGDVVLDVYVYPIAPVKRIHLTAVIPKVGEVKFTNVVEY